MFIRFFKIFIFILFFSNSNEGIAQPKGAYNLQFDSLAKRWDDGIPLGNGWIGALIWQKQDHVRLSLDRVDLWDDRPMPEIDKLKFKWVVNQVKKGEYDTVQKMGDWPYDINSAPTKIPGAALEFNCTSFGKVVSNKLDIKSALSTIRFSNGVVFSNYVHATNERGYFSFENLPAQQASVNENAILPQMKVPAYTAVSMDGNDNTHSGAGLQTLGYGKGTISKTDNSIRYHQPTWGGNYYEVLVQWLKRPGNKTIGSWTITVNKEAKPINLKLSEKESKRWARHTAWWSGFWNKSAVSVPDSIIEKQYYLELYKMGCVARNNTPPISLQAVWTADNGSLPPWKGDIHNDLNTELSYWPFYSGNHLEEAKSFTNWLWQVKEQNKKWTKNYFEIDGLNVPGVTTISGKEMGGWIQYSMSPTTAAWLAQHFYWQWKYGMDQQFLLERCKPWFDEVYKYFSKILVIDRATGKYKLPLSSSAEIHDNSIKAWFKNWTNYDLALVTSFYNQYIEITKAATGHTPANILKEKSLLPNLDINETGLTIAPGNNLDESHRHMSPYMAIYPLGLLNIDSVKDKVAIENSLQHIEENGTRAWVGYSFSWMANMYARSKMGEKAADMLRKFATNFCSINSFHLNGDQKGGQYSGFTYRPFTLEGNFAFAQGVQEMLLQSQYGIIKVFPAVPKEWTDVSFEKLRAEGAFLISAKKENGTLDAVKIFSEKGGLMRLKLPFKTFFLENLKKKYQQHGDVLEVKMAKGETMIVKNGYE